jgi:D-methionine transport system permease protein
MIETLFPNVDWGNMWEATLETIYMTAMATGFTFVIGLV